MVDAAHASRSQLHTAEYSGPPLSEQREWGEVLVVGIQASGGLHGTRAWGLGFEACEGMGGGGLHQFITVHQLALQCWTHSA